MINITYTLKIVGKRNETNDTVTLCFKQPVFKKVKYLPGQFLSVIARINGRRYIRPYSFSSCPGVDELLEITVKKVTNGIVSNYLNDVVKVGDSIEVMPPMGDFVYRQDDRFKEVYLWGVGSGITPLISIAKFVLTEEKDVRVYLIYGNRCYESTIFLDSINGLQQQYGTKLIVKHFHTKAVRSENYPDCLVGRIDESRVVSILEESKDLAASVHYICGPKGLKQSVKNALIAKDVNLDYIFSEDFEIVKDPKDFENIQTREVVLKFQGKSYKLEVTKGKSILEAALDSGIELPYSCQTGNCSTCSGIASTGEVAMIGLSQARNDLMEREYLLCCSYPLDNNVLIEI